jgi:hypothetical protein
MNDTQLLSEVGAVLYGAHWQAALASEIAVSDRSMRRWANGTDPIPWGVWLDVYRHIEARSISLNHWKDELYHRVVIRKCEQRPVGPYDPEEDWVVVAHEPLDGRHSAKHTAVVRSLAEVQAVMKKHPGMIFQIRVPPGATAAERNAFERMNITKVFP